MGKLVILLGLVFALYSCEQKTLSENPREMQKTDRIQLTIEQASKLAALPLHCMEQEFPNKLNQTLSGESELGSPRELHPAFYGCFDWHSAVHGHWMLVKLLKEFPDLPEADLIRKKLSKNLSKENILAEVAYFEKTHEKSFERTYGWAWLLKLAEELHTWKDDSQAKEWEANLQVLTDLIVERYLDFLPKLVYPVRVGEHPNTAFGMSFAWDFAEATEHSELKALIEQRSRDFFMEDKNCPLDWEPGGYDFLSPCLEEADMMRRVLNQEEFRSWFDTFLPQLIKSDAKLAVGLVSDRSDGKLVHLDGVNLSRAWCLYGIASDLREYPHLIRMANDHLEATLPNIVDDDYAGSHWLASFAIYALTN